MDNEIKQGGTAENNRAEQQWFERGLKLGVMLGEYINAGGSISKLLELIAQADTATEQAKGGVIYAD